MKEKRDGYRISNQLGSRKISKPKLHHSKPSFELINDKDAFDLVHCKTTEEDLERKPSVSLSLSLRPELQISNITHVTHKEITLRNMDMYACLAMKALAYYNMKERTNLVFKDVTVGALRCGPKSTVHLNFIASLEDDSHLLFAELVRGNWWKQKSPRFGEFHVKGCCLLQKIDSGNPLGHGCSLCCYEVIHPGPFDGYRIVGGDAFRGYDFWEYIFRSTYPKPIQAYQDMYAACAQKALEYFNAKQHANLKVVEVVGGANCLRLCERIVHVNFKSCAPEEELFYAELRIPMFYIESEIWDAGKEPFIEVKGCCKLEKLNSGNPFGRVCEFCYHEGVIHPGPRDGYCVTAGDDFLGNKFFEIGHGFF